MTQSIFCVLDKMSTWDRHNLCDFTNQGPNLYIVQLELLIWNQTIFHLFSLGILVYWWLSSVASLSLSLSLSLSPHPNLWFSFDRNKNLWFSKICKENSYNISFVWNLIWHYWEEKEGRVSIHFFQWISKHGIIQFTWCTMLPSHVTNN